MSVSGPENVDQEIELHKSLLKDVEDLLDDGLLNETKKISTNLQKISDTVGNIFKRQFKNIILKFRKSTKICTKKRFTGKISN